MFWTAALGVAALGQAHSQLRAGALPPRPHHGRRRRVPATGEVFRLVVVDARAAVGFAPQDRALGRHPALDLGAARSLGLGRPVRALRRGERLVAARVAR